MPYTDFDIISAMQKFKINRVTPMDANYESFICEFKEQKDIKISSVFTSLIKSSIETYHKFEGPSEIWLRTNFIFPFLFEMREEYKNLMLWEGRRLDVDPNLNLTGEPDYFVTKLSRFPETPYFIVGEAKRDDFIKGWGQCLSAMIAAQILNQRESTNVPIYGVVTSGIEWEFGRLENKDFGVYPQSKLSVFEEKDRYHILNILHNMFTKCKEYVGTVV